MIFIFGSRLFGKVDEVPGLFHVATKFGHLNFLPLVPMQSYVVLEKQGSSFRELPIPISGKSIAIAWGRVVAVAAAAAGCIGALVDFTSASRGDLWPILAAIGAIGVGLVFFLWRHKGITRASFERACELGRQIGMTEQGMAEIYRIYGQLGSRGFEVQSTARAPAPPPMPGLAFVTTAPAPAAPMPPASFFVTGVNRTTGETTCVNIWADSPDAARALGHQRGIDVHQVESAGPRGG